MATVTAVDEPDLPALDYVRRRLCDLWEAVADQRRCDFAEAFAKPYPVLTIAEVMGAPRGVRVPGGEDARPGARRRAGVRFAARCVRPRRAADPLVVRA